MSRETPKLIIKIALAFLSIFLPLVVRDLSSWYKIEIAGCILGAVLLLWGIIGYIRASKKHKAEQVQSIQQIPQAGSDRRGERQEAAREFHRILLKVHDSLFVPYTDDEYEVCEYRAKSLRGIEKELGEYLTKHGVILPKNIHDAILDAKHAATEAQYSHVQGRSNETAKGIERTRGLLEQAWETLQHFLMV